MKTSFCGNRECEFRIEQARMAKMARIYIRETSDQEYKSKWGPKYKKQHFKPIGWVCLICKEFHLDEEYGKPGRKASVR